MSMTVSSRIKNQCRCLPHEIGIKAMVEVQVASIVSTTIQCEVSSCTNHQKIINMQFFAIVLLVIASAAVTLSKPTEAESLEPLKSVSITRETPVVPRDKRGLLFGGAYTAPVAYTSAYRSPVAYTSSYSYGYPYAYSAYPYYASAYTAPYYLA
ncbi:uncharacterized protein [Fopius arisanus]|nr:PREDICTED: uncharacterized protein LOC105267385 [Fopius arisanus]